MTEITTADFLIELETTALVDGKPFDGVAAGEFVSMSGAKVKIDAETFADMVANTLAAIEATRGESGELAGLPIDARGHDHGDGAGWIVDVARDGDKIRITPRWTEVGLELLKKGIRRFFSATIDLTNKVILGGTLTNWPATRDKTGKIMLRPIELELPANDEQEVETAAEIVTEPGANDGAIDPEETEENLTMNDELKTQISDLIRAELQTALADVKPQAPNAAPEPVAAVDLEGLLENGASAEFIAEFKRTLLEQQKLMREQAGREAAAELEKVRHEGAVVEFCQRSVGGSDAAPVGLPVQVDALKEFALSLNKKQFAAFADLIDGTLKSGLVDYREHGHGKDPQGTVELEDIYKPLLTEWIESGQTATEFFRANPELGPMARYNLAEFDGKEK